MGFKAGFLFLACFILLNTKGGAIRPPDSKSKSSALPLPPVNSSPLPSPANSPLPPPLKASPPPPVILAPPPPPPPQPPRTKEDCTPLCKVRCKNHSRQNICMRACSTCCVRCKCVPPGQYGNKETCKCYANMTTTGGKPKCP